MVYNNLIWLLFILLINIRRTDNSLLSRFKNPSEYVPRDGKYFFLEDLDDEQYAALLQEVPELAGKLRFNHNEEMKDNTKLPFIRKELNGSSDIIQHYEDFDSEKDEDQEEYPGQLDYVTVTQGSNISSITPRLPFLTRWPFNTSDEAMMAKEKNIKSKNGDEKRMATCYWCGMNHSSEIPVSSLCHDAFESPDWRARTLARYFRAHCFKSRNIKETIKPYTGSGGITFHGHNGLIRQIYGWYTGGCFKRFLDVGKVYTQRGCRSWWPKSSRTRNFANHRFTRLEALIHKESDCCIVSPHATLTPFSRSISLYVRYHVCVCEGKYCNKTAKLYQSLTIITVFLVLTLIHF